MKIGLIGYGKMGRAVESLAGKRDHNITLKINSANRNKLTKDNLAACDVAIELSGAISAAENIIACINAGIPVVSGSTGWMESWEEVKEYCLSHNGGLLYASNFSIGVNIFFEINRRLSALMASRQSYDVAIEEIHHTHKKDAPSGTAITLATDIIENLPRKKVWTNTPSDIKDELVITSKRIDPDPGTHIVKYMSGVDDIEIMHTAHNRTGFAEGALLAAEFLTGKIGIYSMKDVLQIQ